LRSSLGFDLEKAPTNWTITDFDNALGGNPHTFEAKKDDD